MDGLADDAAFAPAPMGPAKSRKRAGRRTYLTIGAVLLALALLCGGITAGWYIASERNFAQAGDLPDTAPGPTAEPATRVMPDLRGLGLDAALQILADLGVPASAITRTSQPAAGEVGVVLVQSPVFGSPADGKIQLTVSKAARVPAIKGRKAAEVLSELEQLGAQVRTVSRYVPGATVGSISSIRPGVGKPLSDEVVVVIATAPAEINLVDLDSVDYGCGSDSGTLNGTTFDSMLTCDADSEPTEHSYVVNRGGSLVRGTFGIPDDSETGEGYSTSMHLDVLADGRVVASYDVRYGATTSIRADVSGALRITFRVRSNNENYGTGALGNLILEGDPTKLASLTQEP